MFSAGGSFHARATRRARGCHVAASPASSCLYTLLAPFRRCCYRLGMRSLVGRQALHEAIMGGRQSKKACTQPLRGVNSYSSEVLLPAS